MSDTPWAIYGPTTRILNGPEDTVERVETGVRRDSARPETSDGTDFTDLQRKHDLGHTTNDIYTIANSIFARH